MRIPRQSSQLTSGLGLDHLANVKWRMARTERVATTLLEIARPSDAPSEWTSVHRLAAASDDQGVFRKNTETAITFLDTSDQLLADATEVMKRAWELAVQMSNDPHDAASREAAGKEIDSLRTRMLSIANTQVANRHVFGGQAMDVPPFLDDATYVGSTESLDIRIGYREWIQVGYDGSEVFQGNVDVFEVLDSISGALAINDVDGVRAELTNVKDGIDQLIRWREEVGFNQNLADDTVDMVRSMQVVLSTRLAETVQADPAEAYTALAEQQTAYEATLQMLATTGGTSLFNFMR
jgi:flagellar hook-associated protein 3 FlgL